MAAEKVGILIELENADTAFATLKRIESTVNDLGRKKTMIKLDDGSLVSVDERIKQIQDRLAALGAAKKAGVIKPEEVAEAKRLSAELQVIKRGLKEGTANARTFAQTFNGISSKVAHIGSAMQSFGNAMTQLTSPFRRLTNGIVLGAGFKALNSFTEGFERGFTRYDTMKKYPKIMAAFGYSADESEKSIKALDLSVRGLPTGLDEMVDLAQRFTATTGDIDKGTKLAIAANNAFLASMSTDTQKYQGMMQLQDVLGGKDMNAREWNSLVSSMTPAIVKMGESLGYTSDNMGEWIQKVRDGKVDNQDFIDTLIKIGNEGGVLEAMAQESKNTWQAFFANVGNAASRMTAGVIKAFDEISQAVTGKDVNQLFSDTIIPKIDETTKSIQNWVKAHPEEITNFFKDLSKIKFGSLLKGYAKGLGEMAGVLERFAKLFGGKGLGGVGRFLGWGNLIGKASTIIGGLLKGTRHIWGFFGAGGAAIGGKLAKGGIFGKIASIFGSGKSIKTAETTAKTIPSVADTFKGAFSALSGLIKAAGAITLVAGTGFVAFKSAKSILRDLKDMVDLVNGGGWDNVGYVATGVIAGIGAFTEIFQAIGTALGPKGLLAVAIASAASFLVTGTFAGDMRLIKDGVISIRDTITELDNVASAITNMKGIGTLGDDIKEKFRNTIDAINEIKRMFDGKNGSPMDRGVVEQGLPTFGVGKVGALTNIANAITQMQKIVAEFNKLATLTVNDPSAVLKQIKDACNQLQGIRGPKNIEAHTTAVANALKQIKTMANRFNTLAGMTVNTGGFAAFVQQIKEALSELQSLNQTMTLDIKVVLGDGFKTSVDGVVKQINNARTRINNAMKKIPNAITKHISVTITASVNTKQAVNAITNGANYVKSIVPKPSATGGLIYRAKGGSIPWKRRGTDTVPAMLTPGEFVHNRKAVSAFGIDFMHRVNNLDVKGAMNELMHRAGSMANVNRGATITNNNYNNQRVTINNNGASGAGFTFKTASRFVGAL